jgi:hypothetical protein
MSGERFIVGQGILQERLIVQGKSGQLNSAQNYIWAVH